MEAVNHIHHKVRADRVLRHQGKLSKVEDIVSDALQLPAAARGKALLTCHKLDNKNLTKPIQVVALRLVRSRIHFQLLLALTSGVLFIFFAIKTPPT